MDSFFFEVFKGTGIAGNQSFVVFQHPKASKKTAL
jgi:hypothetical protein